MDPHHVGLETQMSLRVAELRRDLRQSELLPPFTLKQPVASIAGSIRRLAERVEGWAKGAGNGEAAFAAGGREWHNL